MASSDGPPLSEKQVAFITDSDAPINIADGSIRAGKTIASLFRWLHYVANPPASGELVMVGKTQATVARNCFAPLQNPSIFGELSRHVHYTAGAPTARILGRTVHVLGANDAKAESKVRGFSCAGSYVDELTLLPHAFWQQLLGRHSDDNAQIFATTNPDNPQHWVKAELLNGTNEDVKSWHFVMDDNPRLSEAKKAFWRRQYTGLWYKRFILGQWCQAEGSVYDMWDPDRHVVKDVPPIIHWISAGIDHGTRNPFAAVLLGVGLDRKLYAVSEWRWESAKMHRQLAPVEYSARVRQWLADPTPDRAPEHRLRDVQPPYLIIDPSAAGFIRQCHADGMRPWPADNAVIPGIQVVSNLLTAGQFAVAERCEGLIGEFPGYVWDPKSAELGIDKVVKANDHCLTADTLITTRRGDVPIESVTTSDEVLTRSGWRCVTDSWQTSPSAHVVTLHCSNGATVTGTPNHRVWAVGRGWIAMDALRYGDRLVAWQTLTSSSSMESGSGGTRTRDVEVTASTTPLGKRTEPRAPAGFTRRSGKPSTVRSQTDTTSTMSTVIHSTTTSPTWSASRHEITTDTTPTTPNTSDPKLVSTISAGSGHSLPNGIAHLRAGRGTPSMLRRLLRHLLSRKRPACTAEKPSGPSSQTSSAQTSASLPPGGRLGLTTRAGSAISVALPTESTSTARMCTAHVHVVTVVVEPSMVPVYDLTVAGAHEFFANGILVHNSLDADRYGTYTTQSMWRPLLASVV